MIRETYESDTFHMPKFLQFRSSKSQLYWIKNFDANMKKRLRIFLTLFSITNLVIKNFPLF